MLSLKVFGGFQASIDGDALPKPKRRKTLELLALLAVQERGKGLARATLQELLWPKHDEDSNTVVDEAKKANSLSQLLVDLRRILGNHANRVLETVSRELYLDPAQVETDCWQIEACLKAQQGNRAQRLSFGGLLPGWDADWIKAARQEIAERLAEVHSGVPTHTLRPAPLPLPFTQRVGRTEELQHLKSLVMVERLVSLIGTGGVGKTNLALGVAEQLQQDGSVVAFVDLSIIENPHHVPVAIATALGAGKAADWTAFLVERIRSQALTLVLDNCEHLSGRVGALVQRMCAAAPELHCLVTSRTLLGIAGEKKVLVKALDSEEGCRLLQSRVRDLVPDWEFEAQEAHRLRAIVAQLEGNPLALELIASAVAVLGADTVVQGLEKTLFSFDTPHEGRVARHRSISASLGWGLQRLTPEEQRIFRGLAVFRGGFDRDAMAEVLMVSAEEAQRALLTFIGHSLVTRATVSTDSTAPPRWRLLETVRQYAHERLTLEEEGEAREDSHLRCFWQRAQNARDALHSSLQAETATKLFPDLDNFRAAVASARSAPDRIPMVLELLHFAHRFWMLHGFYEEFYTNAEWLLNEAEAKSIEVALTLRLDVLDEAAGLAFLADRFDRAETLYDRELVLAQQSANELLHLNGLYGKSLLANVRGKYLEARQLQERILPLRQQQGDALLLATAHNGLGITLTRLGDYDLARQHLDKSLTLKEANHRWTTSYIDSLFNRISLEVLTGNWSAVALFRDSLHETVVHLGDKGPEIESNFQNLFGVMLSEQNQFAEAASIHTSALAFFEERNQVRGIGEALVGLGRACLGLGEWLRSEKVLQEALTQFQDIGDLRRVAECYELRALLAALQADYVEAQTRLEQADEIRSRIASPVPPIDRDKIQRLRDSLSETVTAKEYDKIP